MMTPIDRLLQFVESKGYTKRSAEQKLLMGNGRFGKMIANKTEIKDQLMEKILLEFPELNPQWLISGKGEMTKKPEKKSLNNQTNNKVPFYEIDVSASVVEVFTDSAIETPSSELSVPGLEDCDFAVPVYGHSMYPIYENGTIIVCKEVQDKQLINYGEIYFIVTKDYRMVKRLQRGSKDFTLLAESENTEKRINGQLKYEPIELPVDSILRLYLVKGCIKRNQL